MLKSILVAFGFVVLSAFAATGASADSTQTSKAVSGDGSFQVAASWDRVCCKRGARDWFTSRRECRRAGGWVAANRQCRNDRYDRVDYRVCCKRGHRDWWSTARSCRRAGGYVASARQCRNG